MSDAISWKRGEKYIRSWKVNSASDKAITGATINVVFRRTVDGTAIITKSLIGGVSTGVAISSDVAGDRRFELTIAGSDTSGFESKNVDLLFDGDFTYSDGDGPYVFAKNGKATVSPDIAH